MPAGLSRMLGKPKKEVAQFIAQMEDEYCYPSQDVRLLDETVQAVNKKISGLGLDPGDTTSEELYHSLLAKFDCDAATIDKALGVSPSTGFESRLSRAIDITKHAVGEPEIWALKPSAAKRQLQDQPPKKLTRLMHYRSVESMLKRENIGQLYLLSAQAESQSWQNNLAKAIAHLPSSDYGVQTINFVRLPTDKIDTITAPPDLNVCNKLTASVALWPSSTLAKSPVITMALLLIQAIQKLGVPASAKSLFSVHPALAWWSKMEHLISPHLDQPISLNIHDVSHNHQNSLSYKLSSSSHAARALWEELAERYHAMGDGAAQIVQNEVTNLIGAHLAAEYQEA